MAVSLAGTVAFGAGLLRDETVSEFETMGGALLVDPGGSQRLYQIDSDHGRCATSFWRAIAAKRYHC